MNLITVSSLCLLLASGALAVDLSQYGTNGRIRGLKTGPKPPPPSKKSSKGMDRPPVHPTPSPPATECQIFGVTFYRDDIPDYFTEAEVAPGVLVGGLNKYVGNVRRLCPTWDISSQIPTPCTVANLSFDRIPFYDTASGDQLGTYTDGGIRYGTNSSDECVGTAAFNFDPLNDEGFASSQINLQ